MTASNQAMISFKEQYKTVHAFVSLGGTMRFRKMLQAREVESPTVVLVPGWCESFSVMRPVALGFTKIGYNVLVLDYQHLDDLSLVQGRFDSLPESVPENEYLKALALTNFLSEHTYVNVSVVAHSEGAIIGTLAVQRAPQLFKNLVLVNPAGLIKEKSFRDLSARFIYAAYKQDRRNFSKHLWLQLRYKGALLKTMFKNPIQVFKDGFAMSNHNIVSTVAEVCAGGTQVDFIFNRDDALFTLDKLQSATNGLCTDGVHVMEGGHNEMYISTDDFVALTDTIIR